jgi:hypothetical protein
MKKALASAGLFAALILASTYSLPASIAASPPGPKKCYQSYLRNLYYAKELQDVSPYWSSKRSALWTSLKPDAKRKKLEYLKSISYVGGKYKVVSEKIEGNTAHLVLKGINVDSNKTRIQACVNADMVHENGFWKIANASTKYVGRPTIASR